MQSLNLALFDLLAAGFAPNRTLIDVAIGLTTASPWLLAALLAWAAWRQPAMRGYLLLTVVVAGATSMLSKDIAGALGLPRPFMAGLSPEHLSHGERGGLPSTHASVMFALAFMLLQHRPLRAAGWSAVALAIVTGWSRIHLGVHFPADIALGALLGAGVAATLGLCLSLAPRSGRDDVGDARWPIVQALMHDRVSAFAALACGVAAIWVGLRTPDLFPLQLMQEGGPIETGTIVLYLLAVACVAAAPPPSLSALDKIALAIVLSFCAAREADWLPALFDAASPGAALDVDAASAWQFVTAAGVALPLLLSAGWLIAQYAALWRRAQPDARWRTPAITVLTLVAVMVLSKTLDQTPDTLRGLGLVDRMPATLSNVVRSLEETLEMLLPVLAMLALLQDHIGRRRGRGRTATVTVAGRASAPR